jgi:hypothetical protein
MPLDFIVENVKIFICRVIIHTFGKINRKFAFFRECCYNDAVAETQQQFLKAERIYHENNRTLCGKAS